MIPESLRQRITELKRSAVRRPADAGEGVGAYVPLEVPTRPSLPPSSVSGHPFAGPADARLRRRVEDISPGGCVIENDAGGFYLIDRPVQDFIPKTGVAVAERYVSTLNGLTGREVPHDPFETFQCLKDADASSVLFVDIEATGFTAGTPLFLIGALRAVGDSVRVEQLLARDYTEEGALLCHFGDMLRGANVVVSFNGKTYDLPYIRDRMLFFGLPFSNSHHHVDILHEGRRRFRDRLPNCKLQTLERAICKRGRIGDIPGADIPDAYHHFVRTGNAIAMEDILQHNALDLVSLAEIVLFMIQGRSL